LQTGIRESTRLRMGDTRAIPSRKVRA
jgi:hypothetical protein